MKMFSKIRDRRAHLAWWPLLAVVLGLLVPALHASGSDDTRAQSLLTPEEESARMVRMMGGAQAVRSEADAAIGLGGGDNCAWALRLTGILLGVNPEDAEGGRIRDAALRCLAEPDESGPPQNQVLADAQDPAKAPSARIAVLRQGPDADDHATMTHGDPWNVTQNFLSVSVADANWTINEDFPGTKLIFDGRYALRKEIVEPKTKDCDCAVPPPKQRVIGALRGHLQWGEGETALEYARLSFSAVADQRDYAAVPGRLTAVRDMYEWGVVQGGKDDPLGVDYYGELVLARFARTWARAPRSSPWWVILGLEGSVGYSWSESDNEFYESVSNPIVGTSVRASLNRSGMGSIYLQQRIINGFGFSSPARSGAVSREARFRFGYLHRFNSCLALDLFVEKRSFNFSDPQLPDLYTKSKRVGAALACAF